MQGYSHHCKAHCHADAISALQLTCAWKQAIIAVPNAILMANHQAELAGHLAALGHLVSCTPDTLVPTLLQADLDHLQPYQPGDPSGIVQHIDAIAASL